MKIFGYHLGSAGIPVPFADYLGVGWYHIESDAKNTWAWSLDRAEMRIPERAEQVALSFTTIYRLLTGRPQRIRVLLDGEFHSEHLIGKQRNRLAIPCVGKRLLSLEIEVVRPFEYPGQTETRPLGICLGGYRIRGPIAPGVITSKSDSAPTADVAPNGPPQTLQVEITVACHLKCIMCMRSVGAAKGSPHMAPEVWARFYETARHVENVHFLGSGEPFLYPGFTRCLRDLDEQGATVSFSTSGDLVDAKAAADLAALRHISTISVSIDSPDPAMYQSIRGQALARALGGLERMMGAVQHPDRVRLVAVVMKRNMQSLLGFPELLTRHGVSKLVLRGMIDTKGTVRHEIPDYDERDLDTLRQVQAECERAGITVSMLPSIPVELITIGSEEFRPEQPAAPCRAGAGPVATDPFDSPLTQICHDPWEFAAVSRTGEVFPCDASNFHAPMGSLTENSFDDIWHGATFNDFRRNLLCGKSTGCGNCQRRHIGMHPLNLVAAELQLDASRLRGAGPLTLRVRNTGRHAWDASTGLVIGASRRKDRCDSAFYHPSWRQPNRIGSFAEARVEPGALATFTFQVNPDAPAGRVEHFQLLLEGQTWLPNTYFTLES